MEMFDVDIHPRKLTWNLKWWFPKGISYSRRLFSGSMLNSGRVIWITDMMRKHDTWCTQCTGIFDCMVLLYDDMTGSEHDNTMHNDITDIWNIYEIYDIYMDKLFTPIWAHMMDVYINILLPRPTPAHILLYTIILSSVLSYKSSYISHDMSWYSYLYLLRVDPLLHKSWPVIQGLPHRMPQLFIYWIRVLRNLSPWYFITIAGNFRPKDHRFHLRLGSVRAQYYRKVPWFSTKNIT